MSIIVDKLSYKYSPNTVYETLALDNISLKIEDGEFLGIIGRTGSGKTSLAQHLNGLLKPSSGTVYYKGEDIFDKDYSLVALRGKVGMVFQYPEYQLFETTVLDDVKFGPKNQGLSDKDASIRAYEALELLQFPREFIDQSPFDLSGGQKRLAAIAGVLAMKPEVLILDEPTAGLDPSGRKKILDIISGLHENTGCTIILVSHSMEDVASYVNRLIVISEGKIALDGTPSQVFSHYRELEQIGLKAPEVTYLLDDLKKKGIPVDINSITIKEAAKSIILAIKNHA